MRPKQVFVATLVVLGTLLGIYILSELREIVVLLIIAFIFASAISPAVTRLNRMLPLPLSIALVYITLIAAFAGILTFITQPLVSQTRKFITEAPDLVGNIEVRVRELAADLKIPTDVFNGNLDQYYSQLTERLPGLLAGVLNVTLGVLTALAGILVVLVLAFYWLLERRNIEGTWLSLVPRSRRPEARLIIEEIEVKLGGYVRGQAILAVIVGGLSFIGLQFIFHLPYALVLAVIAGITELIPLIGPFIGAVPAVGVAFAVVSPTTALWIALMYFIIQQVENHLLVPKVMQASVGLSPLTVLIAVLAGTTLLGFIGALLAVPVASAVQVILNHTLFAHRAEVEAAQAAMRMVD